MKNFRQQLLYALSDDLAGIARRFKKPKITLVIRNLDVEDGDVIVSDDDFDKVIEAINKLRSREDTVVNP